MGMRRRTSAAKGLSFFSLHAVRKGFTLVELLVAMLITGLVAGAVITVFYVFIFHFEQTDELTTAQQNGEMVLTILRNPVLHAGLGMPSSDDFFDSFGGTSADVVQDFDNGAVSITNGGSPSTAGDTLFVLYGVPSSAITTQSVDLDETNMNLTLSPDVSGLLVKNANSTKGWLIFPTAGVPLIVTDATGLTARTAQSEPGAVALYDELYFLRGLKAFVDSNGDFNTQDLTLQPAQPRVENIAAVYYEHSGTLLKVYVAAAGPVKHEEPQYADWDAFKAAFPEWPGPQFEGFDSGKEWKYHRMRVLSESWRIRN